VSFLAVDGLVKTYGPHRAIDGLSFTVEEGECLALLGPSGCGKTTLLNVVAGFLQADAGDVRIAGTSLAAVPPHRRDIGMVFQDYALFPHLTVAENVGFGLRMRGVAAGERRQTAERVLDLVGLAGFGARNVHQLSGGQRQRVAVARALAIRPRLLLFDEPLSNLDARLRESMRTEIRALLARTGITALFVTHDQAEAFAVADRIALLNQGRLEQIDTPAALYERPASRFAAGFLGSCNLISGTSLGADGETLWIAALGGRIAVAWRAPTAVPAAGQPVSVAVRPHHIGLAPGSPGSAENVVVGRVETIEYLGALTRITVRHASGALLTVELSGRAALQAGDAVSPRWHAADGWALLDAAQR
jgi:ABC-type Fe3+/spermidine/putrescine transport system ATPase subunit